MFHSPIFAAGIYWQIGSSRGGLNNTWDDTKIPIRQPLTTV